MARHTPASDVRPSISYRSALGTIGHTLKLTWELEKAQVGIYSLGATLEITGTLVSTYAGARLVGLLFTAIQDQSQRGQVWEWLIVTVASQLAVNLGYWLMNYAKRILYLLVSRRTSIDFMRQLCQIDIQTFHDTERRNLINKLESGFGWQMSNTAQTSLDLTYACVRAVAIVAAVATVAWWIAPFLFLFLIPSLVAETKTAKAGWVVWDEKGDERHVYWGIAYMVARSRYQLEIRALQAKKTLLHIVDTMLSRFQLKQRHILKNANKIIGPAKVFEIAGIAFTEIWLLIRVLYRHNLSISSYLFYSGMIARVNGALNTIVGSYTGMQDGLLYARDFYAFQQLEPSIVGTAKGSFKLEKDHIPEIRFNHVWFRYPGSEKWVFEDLNFVIQPGEHIALVGENGAGKTTIVKLLLRFYDIEQGSIEIDGHDIRSLYLPDWYRQLGTLFQEFNQYPLNVQENITISSAEPFDQHRLQQALEDSGVKSIVDRLPYGLETVLDSSFKKGTEPSGGQWQRVALARAFYRNANILILDEPTAAIDAKAEYEIFNSIFRHQAEKSAIIISHRFSTVRRADRIIVLEKGRIMEVGSHAELMERRDGIYKDMFEKQAEGYR